MQSLSSVPISHRAGTSHTAYNYRLVASPVQRGTTPVQHNAPALFSYGQLQSSSPLSNPVLLPLPLQTSTPAHVRHSSNVSTQPEGIGLWESLAQKSTMYMPNCSATVRRNVCRMYGPLVNLDARPSGELAAACARPPDPPPSCSASIRTKFFATSMYDRKCVMLSNVRAPSVGIYVNKCHNMKVIPDTCRDFHISRGPDAHCLCSSLLSLLEYRKRVENTPMKNISVANTATMHGTDNAQRINVLTMNLEQNATYRISFYCAIRGVSLSRKYHQLLRSSRPHWILTSSLD
jgi:hypothetical protein